MSISRVIHRVAPTMALALVALAYWRTLAPTVTLEDSGSFIAAAHCLGVAHPPGYPLWCLLAHGFSRLPLGTIAWRVNLFSAVCALGAVWLVYLMAWRLTRLRLAASAAMLALACSSIFWSQAVIAEVYALNALLCAGALYCAMRWRATGQSGWLYALALTCGLGLTNHHIFALLAPVPCVWALARRWRGLVRARTLASCLALFMLGLAVYAYLPLRARAAPPVNWGNPTTLRATIRHIARRAYFTAPEQARYAGAPRDVVRYAADAAWSSGAALTWPVSALALWGGLALLKRRRDLAAMAAAMVFINIVVLNLLLRGTAAPDELFMRRVFYIPAQMLAALMVAPAIRHLAADARRRRQPAVGRCVVAVGLLLPLIALAAHWRGNDRSQDTLARDFALDVLAVAPPDAGLFFVQDEFLFPCLYLRVVEGVRPDVRFVAAPLPDRMTGPLSAVLCDVPPNDKLREYYPFLCGAAAIPWGLAYRLTRPAEAMPGGLLVDGSLRDPIPGTARDPGARRVHAAYAGHYARLGAERFLADDPAAADRHWRKSEAYIVDDPYAHYLLARMYRRCGVHPVRQQWLLRAALTLYRQKYSPIGFRFYPLTEDDILTALDD